MGMGWKGRELKTPETNGWYGILDAALSRTYHLDRTHTTLLKRLNYAFTSKICSLEAQVGTNTYTL